MTTRNGSPSGQIGITNDRSQAEGRASNDFVRDAIVGFRSTSDLNGFLGMLLEQPLRAAGTGHGTVTLLEGEGGQEYVHRIVILEAGKALSTAIKEESGLERTPMTASLRAQVDRIDSSEDGILSYPDDPVFTGAMREHLRRVGVRSIYTMALRVGRKMIGWFAVGYHHVETIDDDRLRVLRGLADQMTIAFTVARLVERSKQAALAEEQTAAALRDGDDLVRANRSLKNALDSIEIGKSYSATLAPLLRTITNETGSTFSALCFRDGQSESFGARPSSRDDGSGSSSACPDVDSALWRVLDEMKVPTMLGSDPVDSSRQEVSTWVQAQSVNAILAIPVFERANVVGALLLAFERPRTFGAIELEMLQVHAHQVQLALRLRQASIEAKKRATLAATLAERSRIARDLSDTLSQGLTGILMHLRATVGAVEAASSRRHVQSALNAARTSLIEARRTVKSLREAGPCRASFGSLLKGVLHTTFAGSSVSVHVDVNESQCAAVPLAIENELLLIAQEFATNTLKHASAQVFRARAEFHDELMTLTLCDDGEGFDHESTHEGFGLAGMRERAACIGAVIAVTSTSGAGAVLTISLPFSPFPS